jgi:hypothetical protein
VGESEESLTREVRVVLTLSDGVLIREHAESVKSLAGFQTGNGGTLGLEVVSEVLNIDDESLDTFNQGHLEVGVLALEVVTGGLGTLNEGLPVVLHGGLGVDLVLVHDVGEVGVDQGVHVVDGLELEINLGLLLSDFLKGRHNTTEGVNVFDGLIDLKLDLLDLVSQVFEESLGLLVKVTGESILPGIDPAFKASLDVFGLEREGANLVGSVDVEDLLQDAVEFLKLLLEVLQLWVVLIEELEGLIRALIPQPRVLLKAGEEVVDLVLGSLDGTGEEEDDLNDFLILSNPVVEGLALIFGLVLLVPVLDLLGGLEHVGGSSVNSRLDLFEGWLEHRLTTLKMHVYLEEGLQDLLGGVPAAANTLFHLVEGVLGSVEQGLVHGPIVVF